MSLPDHDPLLKIEHLLRDMHDRAGKRTAPVLRRYPLLFAFLLTFSAAAILHGFDMWTDRIELFEKHPSVLILAGAILLTLTGALYQALSKMG